MNLENFKKIPNFNKYLRGERRLDAFGMGHLKGAVYFVGGDVVESFSFPLTVPSGFRSLKKRKSTHHVSTRESEGILDAAVHVALGGQVDDAVHLLFLHQRQHRIEIAYVRLHEAVVRPVLNVLEVGQIARIGELIYIDYFALGVLVDEEAHYMAADESGSAGYDYRFVVHYTIGIFVQI